METFCVIKITMIPERITDALRTPTTRRGLLFGSAGIIAGAAGLSAAHEGLSSEFQPTQEQVLLWQNSRELAIKREQQLATLFPDEARDRKETPAVGVPDMSDDHAISLDGIKTAFPVSGDTAFYSHSEGFNIADAVPELSNTQQVTFPDHDDIDAQDWYPRISPDNRYLAFVRLNARTGTDQVHVTQLGEEQETFRITDISENNSIINLEWSSDGKLAFSNITHDTKKREIFIGSFEFEDRHDMELSTTHYERLVEGVDPMWTEDGKEITYYNNTNRDNLYTIDIATGEKRDISKWVSATNPNFSLTSTA